MRALEIILDGLFAFGRVVASRQAGSTKNVLVDLRGDRRQDGTEERNDQQSMWIAAPLLYRAAPPQGTSGEEALYVRRGDEAIIIGTRDMRWQVRLEEGECVVRALGQNAARVRLKPDGTAVVEGKLEVRDAAATATLKVAVEQGVQAELTKIATTLTTGTSPSGPVTFGTVYTGTGTNLGTNQIKVDKQ